MNNHFDVTAGNVSDVGVFMEEEGARIVRMDEVVLLAGFGENEDLGFRRNAEVIKYVQQQIPPPGMFLIRFAGDFAGESRDGIV